MFDELFEIRDVIYGFIILDKQEVDIINSPEFQRLRRIRQLSLTEMVYPGANHTRFEHSLGVMQMASEMYDSLVSKSKNLLIQLGLQETGIRRWRKVIRLAALLHDIGHPPFSHSGEGLFSINPKTGNNYNHEEYSIAIIKLKFKTYIEDHEINLNYGIKVDEVTALLGDTSNPENALNTFALLWKSLISGQLDADRADYLLRDSLHAGVSYGVYDKNRLVRCMVLGKNDTDSTVVAVESGGWHIAESLVIARYQMFTQLYFHKTRRIFDYHINQATKEVLLSLGEKDGCYPPVDRLDDYLAYDDWMIWGQLKQGHGKEHGRIVLDRKHYKCIFETSLLPTPDEEEKLLHLTEELQKKGTPFYLDEKATTKWYKLDKDIPILDEKTGYTKPLSEMSSIIKSLVSVPMIKRLYTER